MRGTEISNAVIIIVIYIYECLIDNTILDITFNWLRNKIHCWTITNNLSSIIFLINILLMTILWLWLYGYVVYTLQTLFAFLSQNKEEHVLYSFCTVINAVDYHCIIHIHYLEKTWKTHKPYCLIVCLLFSSATVIAGCLSNVIITSHMSPFCTFCARAPSGFEYEWNIQRVRVMFTNKTYSKWRDYLFSFNVNLDVFTLALGNLYFNTVDWESAGEEFRL